MPLTNLCSCLVVKSVRWMRPALKLKGLHPEDRSKPHMSLTRHACTEGGIEHYTVVTDSRCRHLYP